MIHLNEVKVCCKALQKKRELYKCKQYKQYARQSIVGILVVPSHLNTIRHLV